MNRIELGEQTARQKVSTPRPSWSSGEISNRMFAALVLNCVGPLCAILAVFVVQSRGFNLWSIIADGFAFLIVPVLVIPVAGFLLVIAATRGQDKK